MAPAAHASTAVRRGRRAKVEAGHGVCLDYLKGKCTREQCRFVHPDLTAYQQLSEAVEAQAGREICEVWAMTGQCKFGAKCNKLHPIVVSHTAGQAIAVPPAAHNIALLNTPTPVEAPATADSLVDASSAAPDLTAEFENFVECMRKTLAEEEKGEEELCWQPSGKAVAWKDVAEADEVPPCSAARHFLQSVLGLDSVLIDIFHDLDLVSC
eukprot:EG_transcript_23849